MAKYMFLVVFAFYSIHSVFPAMECLITDPVALEAGIPNPHFVASCPEFIQNVIKKNQFIVGQHVLNFLPTTCYNVKIKAGPPINDYVTKGCVPFGGCEVVKQFTRKELQEKGYWTAVKNMTCDECIGPKCNQYD